VRDDPTVDPCLTEGVKKGMYLDRHGFPPVSIPGVWAWRKGGKLTPDLAAVAREGRTVFVAFDSDAATNPKVRKAEEALAKELSDRGAVVKVVRLPGTGGGRR
jgi:putative DNA primase/helicase